MAPPQSVYSSTEMWIELEFGNLEKTSRSREPTRNSTHILRRSRATSVGGAHHCAIPAPFSLLTLLC